MQAAISEPHDHLEQEAERAARQVVEGGTPTVAHTASSMQREATNTAATPAIIPPAVHAVTQTAGMPLDPGTRSFMEGRFGYDFGAVRIHAGSDAHEAASQVHANAFTYGPHIAFAAGKFQPGTLTGKRLIAHELAHVVQQHGQVSGIVHRDSNGQLSEEDRKKLLFSQCTSGNCHASKPQPTDFRSFGPADNDALFRFIAAPKPPAPPPTNEHASNFVPKPAPAPAATGCPSGNCHQKQAPAPSPSNIPRSSSKPSPAMLAYIADGPRRDAEAKAQKEKELRQALATASFTGSIYHQNPHLERPAAEARLREQHMFLRQLAPQLADALEQDPGYHKAMGEYAEKSPGPDLSIPAATPNVAAPAAIAVGQFSFMQDNPEYWKTPRGRARTALKSELAATKNALDELYGERHDIVDSSVVIRKTAETVGGTEPPPIAQLDQSRKLIEQANLALIRDDLESAAKLYTQATRIQREASWHWARYKERLFFGADRTVEGLETVRDGSKHALMVLSMFATGGASAPLWIGVGGGIAIDLADAGTKAALGEKVDWSKVAVDAAVQVVLAKFGGRFSSKLVGRLTQMPAFKKFESSVVSAAITSVLNGMESRIVTSAVGSAFRGDTWGETLDRLVSSVADWTLFIDLALGAAHHAMASKPAGKPGGKPAAEAGEHPPAGPKKATKGHAEGETASGVLKEEALAKKPLEDGHEAVVTKEGVGRCSPSPCPVIHVEFATELAAHPELKAWNDKIQAMRTATPAAAADEAAALIRTLEAARRNATKGALMPKDGVDAAFDDLKLDIGAKRAADLQSGKRDLAVDKPLTFDVDEVLPVGAPGIKPQRAVRRALDPANRQLLDPHTNRSSKGLGIDPRQLPSNRAARPSVSVVTNPEALLTNRFSEIDEMKRIFERALASVKNRNQLRPTEIKAEVNRETRRLITEDPGPDAVAVRAALASLGFERLPGQGWTLMSAPPPAPVAPPAATP